MVFPWKTTHMYPNLLISFPMTKVCISTGTKTEIVGAANKTYPPTVLPQQACPFTQWSWKLCEHNVFEKHKFPLDIARSQPNPRGGGGGRLPNCEFPEPALFRLILPASLMVSALGTSASICTYKETKATSQPPIMMESGQCGLHSRNSTSLPFQGHRGTYAAENTSRAGPSAGFPREKWKANRICLPSPQSPIFFSSLYLPLLISCSFFPPISNETCSQLFLFLWDFFQNEKRGETLHSLKWIWNKLPLNQMRNIPLLQVRPKPLVSFKIFKYQEHVMNENPLQAPAQGRATLMGGAHDL